MTPVLYGLRCGSRHFQGDLDKLVDLIELLPSPAVAIISRGAEIAVVHRVADGTVIFADPPEPAWVQGIRDAIDARGGPTP